MAKKIKETNVQLDKQKELELIQEHMQQLSQCKDYWIMSQFKEAWNKKNDTKIQEMIKVQDRIICKFNKGQVTITANMILG